MPRLLYDCCSMPVSVDELEHGDLALKQEILSLGEGIDQLLCLLGVDGSPTLHARNVLLLAIVQNREGLVDHDARDTLGIYWLLHILQGLERPHGLEHGDRHAWCVAELILVLGLGRRSVVTPALEQPGDQRADCESTGSDACGAGNLDWCDSHLDLSGRCVVSS